MGNNSATSTSNNKNKITTNQNFGQKGTTLGPAGSKPHSNGAADLPGSVAKSIVVTGMVIIRIVEIVRKQIRSIIVLAVLDVLFSKQRGAKQNSDQHQGRDGDG